MEIFPRMIQNPEAIKKKKKKKAKNTIEKDNLVKIFTTHHKELMSSIYQEISNQRRTNNPKEYK